MRRLALARSRQPWRCLWRGSVVQITRTTPRRRTILQLRQIFFTDARTFIVPRSVALVGGQRPRYLRLRPRPDALPAEERAPRP